MLLILITLFILILNIILIILCNKELEIWEKIYDKTGITEYTIGEFGAIVAFISAIILFIFMIIVITSHVGVDYQNEKANVTYETLLAKIDMTNSNYEDISKVDVLTEVRDWNKTVLSEKFWSNNILTSWFHSKRYADNLKLIDINSIKK